MQGMRPRLTVVIPAYQEADRIESAIATVRSQLAEVAPLEVVVVDDGSTDGTSAAAERGGADVVLRHEVNRGKGAAVRTGMLAATGSTVAFTDADLSYAPAQLAGMLEMAESGWDVVVGSRTHEDTLTLVRVGRLREVGGRIINRLTHLVLLGRYLDTQCGIKVFRSKAAEFVFHHARIDRFAFDVEIFVIAERTGMRLTEVPVTIENTTRSTVNVVRDAVRLVRDLFRIRRWARSGVYDRTAGVGSPAA